MEYFQFVVAITFLVFSSQVSESKHIVAVSNMV